MIGEEKLKEIAIKTFSTKRFPGESYYYILRRRRVREKIGLKALINFVEKYAKKEVEFIIHKK